MQAAQLAIAGIRSTFVLVVAREGGAVYAAPRSAHGSIPTGIPLMTDRPVESRYVFAKTINTVANAARIVVIAD